MSTLYRAQATALGGRSGVAASSDGRLRVELSTPKSMGGDDGRGTNPEQLLAIAYAASFLTAIKSVARQEGQVIAGDSNVTATVDVCSADKGEGLALSVMLSMDLPGLDVVTAERITEKAYAICAFCGATRGNVAIEFTIN